MKKIISTIMFFAFLATASAQLEVNSTGNVGIGTSTPQYKLDVAGSTRISGDIYMTSSSNILGTTNKVPVTFKMNGVLAGCTGGPEPSPRPERINNVSFGYGALSSNTTGTYNTATGIWALYLNTTGYYNNANGNYALYNNTTGSYNTATGSMALSDNASGSYNTANGDYALYHNIIGDYNTANGIWALYQNFGSYNTASGCAALANNTNGIYNTAVGAYALDHNLVGNYNTAIGAYTSTNTIYLNNATAIGYNVFSTSSNQVRIGNSDVTSIGGFADWTVFSDGRANKNIRTDVPGLDFINRLEPVTYNLDLDVVDGLLNIDKIKRRGEVEVELPQELIDIEKKAKASKEKQIQTGFIAQDVEKIAKSIGYDFSGVDVDETGIYGLRYAEFVVPLVKAVQELSEQNDRLKAQVDELTTLVYDLLEKDTDPALLKSKKAVESVTDLQNTATNGASLQQNSPNPFNQSTVIRYTLPQTVKQAHIVISNALGGVIRQIPLLSGTDSIKIEGNTLSAGIYYYSLYVDNSLVDTKKMILTK